MTRFPCVFSEGRDAIASLAQSRRRRLPTRKVPALGHPRRKVTAMRTSLSLRSWYEYSRLPSRCFVVAWNMPFIHCYPFVLDVITMFNNICLLWMNKQCLLERMFVFIYYLLFYYLLFYSVQSQTKFESIMFLCSIKWFRFVDSYFTLNCTSSLSLVHRRCNVKVNYFYAYPQ